MVNVGMLQGFEVKLLFRYEQIIFSLYLKHNTFLECDWFKRPYIFY